MLTRSLWRGLRLMLDRWQARLMRERPRRGLFWRAAKLARQQLAGQIGLHTALYSSSALVLIVSPSQRQSGEIFRSVMTFYRKLKGAPELAAELALRAEFKNGSRLIALPGNEATIRGYSGANLIILDEAVESRGRTPRWHHSDVGDHEWLVVGVNDACRENGAGSTTSGSARMIGHASRDQRQPSVREFRPPFLKKKSAGLGRACSARNTISIRR